MTEHLAVVERLQPASHSLGLATVPHARPSRRDDVPGGGACAGRQQVAHLGIGVVVPRVPARGHAVQFVALAGVARFELGLQHLGEQVVVAVLVPVVAERDDEQLLTRDELQELAGVVPPR